MKFHIQTLGCKVNQVDSESLIDNLIKRGYQLSNKLEAEIAIINTCTVTNKADNKSLLAIKKSINNPKTKFVFVTGCFSELEKNILQKVRGITGIIKHTEKKRADSFIEKKISKNTEFLTSGEGLPNSFFPNAEGKMHKIATKDLDSDQSTYYEHTRAFLKVQDGCNAFCTYCRIPYARGAPVSRDYDNIIEQIKNLSNKGMPEVILTGVNIGDYKSKGNNFEKLLRGVLENAGEMLVRISTIEPHSITSGVIDSLNHPNLSKHLHLALQGGVDSILSKMNRKYTTAEFFDILIKLRKIDPLFAITSDVITGFCGESLNDFEQSVAFIKQCDFAKLHVFPYSPRPLAKSFYYKNDVSNQEKKRRVSILLDLSEKMAKNYLKKIGNKPQRFILEQYSKRSIPQNSPLSKVESIYHKAGCHYYLGTSEYYLKGILKMNFPKKFLANKNSLTGEKRSNPLKVKMINESPIVFEPIWEQKI